MIQVKGENVMIKWYYRKKWNQRGLKQVFCIYIKVIEAVYENLALKREIFAKLDKICKPSTILCSNTSSLDIDRVSSWSNLVEKINFLFNF